MTCFCHLNFLPHIKVREKLKVLCEIQFSSCSLIICDNWIPCWICATAAAVKVSLSNSDLWTIPDPLLRSWWSQYEWFFFFKWKHSRSLFLQWIRWERWRHMCSWLKKISTCASGSFFFLTYIPFSEGSSLTTTREHHPLTWLGSIWGILTTLNSIKCE